MFNFANMGHKGGEDDSLELLMLALGALAIGLLLGYMLGKHSMPAAKPATKSPQAAAKKAKK